MTVETVEPRRMILCMLGLDTRAVITDRSKMDDT